jgi:hypothetical protein
MLGLGLGLYRYMPHTCRINAALSRPPFTPAFPQLVVQRGPWTAWCVLCTLQPLRCAPHTVLQSCRQQRGCNWAVRAESGPPSRG